MCGLKMTNWHNSCEDIIYKNITDVHWLHKINQLKKHLNLEVKWITSVIFFLCIVSHKQDWWPFVN